MGKKIEIKSGVNTFIANLNDYSGLLKRTRGVWRKGSVSFHEGADFVEVNIEGESTWYLSVDGLSEINTFKIDSIDGDIPLNNSDLFDKLSSALN